MDERPTSLMEQERDLCVCKPYMSNMKAISFEAIRSRTKFLRMQYSQTAEWFKCKYCDVRICCRVDDEEEVEFESWSSVIYGVHRDHPPGCKVRPIPCYFEMVVRQMMANKITGARLAAAVNDFFQYDLNIDAIKFREKKCSSRKTSSRQWQLLPSMIRHLQGLGSHSQIQVSDNSTVERVYIEFKTVGLLKSPASIGVIFLDGCHCYDKVASTLCSAITMTADHHIIPLGFVMGQGETLENYKFLLSSMQHAIPAEIVIFSDQAPALLSAIDEALPETSCQKKPCAWHLMKGMGVRKETMVRLLKTDNNEILQQRLEALIQRYPAREETLRELHKKCGYLGSEYVNAFGLLADSPIESFNSAILPARRKEPIDLIVSVVQWANKAVQSQLERLRGRYCTSYERLLSYREALGDSMVIQENEDHTWTIQESFRGIKQMAIYTVSGGKDNPVCTCGGYKRDGAPCRHILVLANRGKLNCPSPIPCYLSSNIREALMNTQMNPDVSTLDVADVQGPEPKPRAGRPRYQRNKSTVEHMFKQKKAYRCTICHQKGHTAKTHEAFIRQQTRRPHGRQTDPAECREKRDRIKLKMRTFVFDQTRYQAEHPS